MTLRQELRGIYDLVEGEPIGPTNRPGIQRSNTNSPFERKRWPVETDSALRRHAQSTVTRLTIGKLVRNRNPRATIYCLPLETLVCREDSNARKWPMWIISFTIAAATEREHL